MIILRYVFLFFEVRGGVLELAYYRAAGDGQAFPTRERYRVLD